MVKNMILDQSFTLSDIPRIFTLTLLELLLSADNAVVLGVLSQSLPTRLRKKALYIGVASAFFLRAGALLIIATLIRSIWIRLLGGAYLLYLSIRYFQKKRLTPDFKPALSFWKVVFLIEILDLIFAVDSIVAGVAFINGNISKLWIVYLGGMLGILGMRYAADIFGRLMDRFPKLEMSAYLMVGWIGVKLGFSAFHWKVHPLLFWSVILYLFLLAFLQPKR